jgi:hypothetical protein
VPDGKADGSAKPPRAPDESKAPGKNVRVVPTSRGAGQSSLTNAKCTQSGIFEMPAVRWHGTCATTPGRKICSARRKDREGDRKMMSRLAKTVTVMVLATPLIVASLGGCIWHTKETKEVERERGGDKR